MSELIDQIAAEHWFTMNNGWHCVGCGYNDFTAARDSYALAERRHLADVTERAVRDAIVAELEARVTRNIGGHPYSDVARTYQLAARIAKGD